MVEIKDNKKENNNTSKQVLLSVLGVAILIVAVVGISFAAFTYTQAGTTTNTISTGTVTMAYNEPTNGIDIQNAIPMDDTTGKALSGDKDKFDFTVSATITGKTTIDYEVVAVKDPSSTIADDKIKLYLEKSEDNTDGNYTQVFSPKQFEADADHKYVAEKETMLLDQGSFVNSTGDNNGVTQKIYYRLRMWVDSSYELTGTSQTYKVTVNVYGKGKD